MKEDANNFSGDMFVGITSVIISRYLAGTLTEKEKDKIRPIFDSLLKDPQVKHPYGKSSTRGYLLPWFTIMGGFGHTMVLSKLCYLLYGDKKYNRLYKILSILSWPISFQSGASVFIGKAEACNWYSENTIAWNYYLGSKLGIKRFERLLNQQARRHYYNPEILGLNCLINGYNDKDVEYIKLYLDCYGTEYIPVDKEDMYNQFDLKHFEWDKKSKYILPPHSKISSKYMTEKDPLKPSGGSRRWVADYFSLSNIYDEITK